LEDAIVLETTGGVSHFLANKRTLGFAAIIRKAAVNAPHSRRFAWSKKVRQSRSTWSAVALAPLFVPAIRIAQKLIYAQQQIHGEHQADFEIISFH
jgi:hypothetical protein